MRTNNESVHEKSIWQTLGALPLQILSVTSLVVWLLFLLLVNGNVEWGLNSILFLFVPGSYFFYSAYVSFRPPRKWILLLTGIVANVPLTLFGVFTYMVVGLGEALLFITTFCGAFIVSWSIFLMSRLTVRAQVKRLKPYRTIARNADHHCLGSRFLEWHEHHA